MRNICHWRREPQASSLDYVYEKFLHELINTGRYAGKLDVIDHKLKL